MKVTTIIFVFINLFVITHLCGSPIDSLEYDKEKDTKAKSEVNNKDSNQDKKVDVQLEFTAKEENPVWEKMIKHGIDLLPSIIAFVGLYWTLPILRRKLTENHITTALNNIQVANAEVQNYNQKLIDKYSHFTFYDKPLNKDNLEQISSDIVEGYYLSQKASSDVTTIMYYLKTTIHGTIRQYDPEKSILFTSKIYQLIIEALQLANFYSTQVVQIPKSTKTEKKNFINNKIKKFVTNSDYISYKHFKIGVIRNPDSAHFTIFYGIINSTGIPLFMRAAYQIFLNPNVIIKHLYAYGIYAAPTLKMPIDGQVLGISEMILSLIGFSIHRQFKFDSSDNYEFIKLIYTNADDSLHFVSSLKQEELNKYSDSWIDTSNFRIDRSEKLEIKPVETIILQYDKNYLEELFTRNKKLITQRLTITKNA